jgi:hypothetical protein
MSECLAGNFMCALRPSPAGRRQLRSQQQLILNDILDQPVYVDVRSIHGRHQREAAQLLGHLNTLHLTRHPSSLQKVIKWRREKKRKQVHKNGKATVDIGSCSERRPT